MICPYCGGIRGAEMIVQKQDYHHKDKTVVQPYNTFLTVLYICAECGTTVETSQQVRITNKKEV